MSGVRGSYWVRTSDPPDFRSGCSEPALHFLTTQFSNFRNYANKKKATRKSGVRGSYLPR